MKTPVNDEAELREALRDGRAVIVAGTGISIAASADPSNGGKPHPQASWKGLLESGLEWLRDHKLITAAKADAHLTLLRDEPDTQHFITAAHDITRLMGGKGSQHFADWLERSVGSIKAFDKSVPDALEALRSCGNLLATTNYDDILLSPELTPVTWNQPGAFVRAARNKEPDKIIFLHGHWRNTESVILDWKSYDAIARDERYRSDLEAIWKMTTWVYVGCGMNGLNDPDLGLLLERHGSYARTAGLLDFCLVRRDQKAQFQAHFDKLQFNIRAVSFGDKHEDLSQFLRSLLPAVTGTTPSTVPDVPVASGTASIPRPPAFYAEPDYIGSHKFTGRAAELQVLTDWAAPADPTNLLLFEAIGGNGKSMLTWEWTKHYALAARPADALWAGRFWYSFYERGAIMADFCRRALTYMTGRPPEDYAKKKTAEMKDELLALLHARPWLLILDGLERVLVAYHRIDAAEVPDEEANAPTDKIVNRNPCDAIRDEDNDLLRALAAAAPSKILVSSRLAPRVLLNPANQPIPGVRSINLPGLRPPDAEALLRSCGIEGDSAAIRNYLAANCDNHPLVIGVLGGLIANYLPTRGNFDVWSNADDGGAALDLASLDLIQRRNHILLAALDALQPASRALLSTLALLTDSVDYETLKAFNPHLPPEPEEVEQPERPEKSWRWETMSDEQKARRQERYEADLVSWQDYENAVQARLASPEFRAAPKKLEATVRDLEQRGLLQWDGREQKYDLHPVVRGVASGAMPASDRERHGQRVVDHFTAQPHRPYEEAETMEDVRSGLHIVRTLLKLGHFQQAADAYRGELSDALFFNLNAFTEILSLLRHFFRAGWGELPKDITSRHSSYLANDAAIALDNCGELAAGLMAYSAGLRAYLKEESWINMAITLRNVSTNLANQNRLAQALWFDSLALDVDTLIENEEGIFTGRLALFTDQVRLGKWAEADTIWQLINSMGRNWSRAAYRLGMAELYFARCHFYQGTLQEKHLFEAEYLAAQGKDRALIRDLHRLRGDWRMEQGEWELAAVSYQEAVRLARERGITDADSETGLALAKHHLGQLTNPHEEAGRLTQLRNPADRFLAMLWLAIGDAGQAKQHALAAYRWAWADGEPYVRRYELTKTIELLQQMNVPIPDLPPYDPAKDEPLPWEADVIAAIEKMRKEKKSE